MEVLIMEEMKLKEFASLVFNARKKFDYVSLMKARDYHEKMVITQKMYPVYIKLYRGLNDLIKQNNLEFQKSIFS